MATKKSRLEISAQKAQAAADRNEAKRLSKEIHIFVQPLMDWYQFVTEDHLCMYLEQACDRKDLKGKVKYSQLRHLVSGEIRYSFDDPLKWMHSTMRRMAQSAAEGRRERIEPKLKVKYVLPKDEPLHNLVERALKEFTGRDDPQATQSIEQILENISRVRQSSGLVKRISASYGFANPQKTHELLVDVASKLIIAGTSIDTAQIPLSYKLLNLTGQNNKPSNYHRKMFAVASVLDYAARNGFKEYATNVILERGRRRSEKAHVVYLTVPRRTYDALFKQMEAREIKGHILSVILSQVLSIPMETAKATYASRDNDVMDLYYYRLLQEFVGNALPNIFVVDLSIKKTRQNEYDKFMRLYRGERVIISYTGAENPDVNKMAANIGDLARKKLGPMFLFDQHNAIKVQGFEKVEKALANSKYG